jgi:hypothetical protein
MQTEFVLDYDELLAWFRHIGGLYVNESTDTLCPIGCYARDTLHTRIITVSRFKLGWQHTTPEYQQIDLPDWAQWFTRWADGIELGIKSRGSASWETLTGTQCADALTLMKGLVGNEIPR